MFADNNTTKHRKGERYLMKEYLVDLTSYSPEERQRIYESLDKISFMCDSIANNPTVYSAIEDFDEPISKTLNIPENLVSIKH